MVLRLAAILLSGALSVLSGVAAHGETGGAGDDVSHFTGVDTRNYNARIEESRTKGETWANLPLSIATNLFGPADYTEGRMKCSVEYSQNQPDTAIVTVTVEGNLDDSVSAERRVIKFSKQSDKWMIGDLRLGFKCQAGRGHTSYSGQLCR